MITHAIITLMGGGVVQTAPLSHADMSEPVTKAFPVSQGTCNTQSEDTRQPQVEEESDIEVTIEHAINEIKRISFEEPEEDFHHQYIYFRGFIPQGSVKPIKEYYSIKEQRVVPTDELPDVIMFTAHFYHEKTLRDYLGYFFCDMTTGKVIGYSHGRNNYQFRGEDGNVSEAIIEHARNEVKRRCAEEPKEDLRYPYIYYRGFIPKGSAKPDDVYYSIKEQRCISTDELPDVLIFVAYIDDENTRYANMGGSGYFYCDATTGELIGYMHGK